MSGFDRKYTDDQRDAAVHAALNRRIRPQRAIVELAGKGELLTPDGRTVRAFDLNPFTLRGWVKAEERRRNGQLHKSIKDPDDTLESLRTRMLVIGNDELTYWERKPRGKRDHEQLRQIARMLREAAAIPRKGEGRSNAPGAKVNGQQTEGRSRGGMAGALLAAHRARPASEPLTHQPNAAENADNSATTRSEPRSNAQEPSQSGSLHREAATTPSLALERSIARAEQRTHTSP